MVLSENINYEKDISIIIVNYNVKDFLYQCLSSISPAKKHFNSEVIVIDNNSTDGSIEFLKPMFPEVNFIELKENIGFGKANNLGFDIAEGKYFLILNPDTVLSEDTLEVMWDYMEQNPEVGMSGCKVLNADGSFQLPCRRGFPTPWASFCKLFGLQSLFPKSKLFAQYNQTFRSENETYYIDAIIGAFMFARADVVRELNGFDPEFFMYGEDLDLCYRTYKLGYKVAYHHQTSIIHYKGESTKRSSINEIKHFYNAMEIFSRKHIANSGFILFFLKFGIYLRSIISIISKHKLDLFFILSDIIIANIALLTAIDFRFGSFMNLPDYAYPTIFIAISLAIFISLAASGEYFENTKSLKRPIQGLMISFFLLSSLTYYFNDFAFSRGVLLMTIGISLTAFTLYRGVYLLYKRYSSKENNRKIAILGLSDYTKRIIESFCGETSQSIELVGIISTEKISNKEVENVPVIGNIDYLKQIIKENSIQEIIISDNSLTNNELMRIISEDDFSSVKFHLAKEYDEVIAARIVNEITNIEPTLPNYNLSKFRLRFAKRFLDVSFSSFLLTIGIPFVYLYSLIKKKNAVKDIFKIFIGSKSFIGIYPLENKKYRFGKNGLTGLAHISNPDTLSRQAIDKLNNYYITHYSLSMDIDIIIRKLLRKKVYVK